MRGDTREARWRGQLGGLSARGFPLPPSPASGGGGESEAQAPAKGNYTRRSSSFCLISAIALAGLRPFGQALAQFMIWWQR